MTPEAKAYWERIITQLVEAFGEDEARAICAEVVEQVGDGGTSRQYTATLLRVAAKHGVPTLQWVH